MSRTACARKCSPPSSNSATSLTSLPGRCGNDVPGRSGVLVPYLSDPFFAICAHVISTVARQHSYSVVLSTTNEDPQAEFEEASRMLRRNVEGLIVIPAHPTSSASLLLAHEFERLPIVTLDRPIEGSRFDSLLVENERARRLEPSTSFGSAINASLISV